MKNVPINLRIKSVSYGRTFSDDNCEFEKMEVAMDLYEGENANKALEELSNFLISFREREKKPIRTLKKRSKKNA